MISNRIKSVLEELISTDQTGFISNKFIGENTRLLYDTIGYCQSENIDGLLIVVDYSTAFDTIEWRYVDQCLDMFNFGKKNNIMDSAFENETDMRSRTKWPFHRHF